MRIYLNREEIKSLSRWADCPESLKQKLGLAEVYLIEVYNTSKGTRFWETFDSPQRTNMTREFRVSGWLGETNNVNRTALGRFPSLKEAIDYVESEEGESIEPLDLESELDRHLVWRGQVIEEE